MGALSVTIDVDYLNEEYDLNIPEEDAYETIGGFIINHTENIPEKDEVLTIGNFQIKILKVSASKIDSISFEVLAEE